MKTRYFSGMEGIMFWFDFIFKLKSEKKEKEKSIIKTKGHA